ncbi:MAG TPA: M12 family metallopeptidase [Chitinophagales bacterium]|nr:M12 family metallopeptidase [Chitinophagales bacterium]
MINIQKVILLFVCFDVVFCANAQRPKMADIEQHFYGENVKQKDATTAIVKVANAGIQVLTFEKFDGLNITQGDIIISKADDKKMLGTIELGKTWANKTLPYIIDANVPSNIRENIKAAIAHWEQTTPIRFTERTTQKDYVVFRRGSSPGIGASQVGCQGGMQEIFLGVQTNISVAIHEIGHTLGLWHEQSRPDRNNFVTIMWQNIIPRYRNNFETAGTFYGDYDFKSRMHYSPVAFSLNGQPTIVPIDPKNIIENDGYLSLGDIAAINALYP